MHTIHSSGVLYIHPDQFPDSCRFEGEEDFQWTEEACHVVYGDMQRQELDMQ